MSHERLAPFRSRPSRNTSSSSAWASISSSRALPLTITRIFTPPPSGHHGVRESLAGLGAPRSRGGDPERPAHQDLHHLTHVLYRAVELSDRIDARGGNVRIRPRRLLDLAARHIRQTRL